MCGPVESPIKHLVQGAYQEDWMRQTMERDVKAGTQGVYALCVHVCLCV